MRFVLSIFLCGQAWAGYASKATVTFAPATGSTQTSITLAFTFSDAKLKTVANGGQIQNTVSRVGLVVPADFVLTNDPTCGSITGGWTWGIETYSATAGTGIGWAMLSSLTTGATVVPTVCFGNASVSTYQGGAQGAEFDANTKLVYHAPDGVALNTSNFVVNSNNGSVTGGAAATAGKIGGGVVLANTSTDSVNTGAISLSTTFTVESWANPSTGVSTDNNYDRVATNNYGSGFYLGKDAATNNWMFIVSGNFGLFGVAVVDNAWTHLVGTFDGTTARLYVNGVSVGTPQTPSAPTVGSAAIGWGFDPSGGSQGFRGKLDELKLNTVARSANWIATEYANQLSPPVMSASTAVATPSSQPFLF